MSKKEFSALTGIVAGTVGVIAVGFLLKKFLSSKKVEQFEEQLVEKILEKSPISAGVRRVSNRPKHVVKKKSRLVLTKLGNAKRLLAIMKKGKEYTQIALEELSKISYRSVRRYIEVLVKQGKVKTKGYGKGKKFMKI